VTFRNDLHRLVETGVVCQCQGGRDDCGRSAHPRPAADQGGNPFLHESRNRPDREIQQFRIIPTAINEREAERNEVTGRLDGGFFGGKLHDGPNPQVEEFPERPPVSGVTDPDWIGVICVMIGYLGAWTLFRKVARGSCSPIFSRAMVAILHPEGVRSLSPGQRPGFPGFFNSSLKGWEFIESEGTPALQAGKVLRVVSPGRCPGLRDLSLSG
jgi:hypothetical protein